RARAYYHRGCGRLGVCSTVVCSEMERRRPRNGSGRGSGSRGGMGLSRHVDIARDTEKEYVLEFEFLMKYARKSGARPGVPTHFFLTPVLHRLAEIA
ncbi:unnamed protein product, partial [Sphacelaria rigidula]